MEDEISSSVYKDYVNAKNWPKNLDPEAFREIKEYLTILIEDTPKTQKNNLRLIKQNDQDKKPE